MGIIIRNSSLNESCNDVQYNRDQHFSCSYSHLGQLKWNGTIGVTSKDPVYIHTYIHTYIYIYIYIHIWILINIRARTLIKSALCMSLLGFLYPLKAKCWHQSNSSSHNNSSKTCLTCLQKNFTSWCSHLLAKSR